MSNEDLVRRYTAAAAAGDVHAMEALRHPRWSVTWPQSGERVTTNASFAAIVAAQPGGAPRTTVERIVGDQDRVVLTALGTPLRVGGSGDFWWAEFRMAYPDGIDYHCIELLELSDEKVFRETVYWAAPFEAPAWRAAWVEQVREPETGG